MLFEHGIGIAEYRYFASIAANRIITSRYSTCSQKPHRYCSVANNVEFNDCHAASTYCRLANGLTLSMLSMSTANKSCQVCFLTSALSRGGKLALAPHAPNTDVYMGRTRVHIPNGTLVGSSVSSTGAHGCVQHTHRHTHRFWNIGNNRP